VRNVSFFFPRFGMHKSSFGSDVKGKTNFVLKIVNRSVT